MKPRLLFVVMGLLSFLFGSCSKLQPSAKPLPEITANSEDNGFVDLGFVVRSHERLRDGSQILYAAGTHHGREVRITVVLGTRWKEGKMGPVTTYQGMVSYRSMGAQSDALLQVLDQLYGTKLQPKVIRSDTVFTAISLGGEPADLGKGPTKLKLFFESDAEDRYAELYTNIDLANNILQIHEKDPDYRSAIIHALRSE